jgi:NAD(P)-dependent dehydrogenase (short-subunit alcohol dehydrogenase family)
MNVQHQKKIALITGANKGIGFETARQLAHRDITVIIGARDQEKGKTAVSKLCSEGLDAHFVKLKVTDEANIQQAAEFIAQKFGKLDILVNNAGVNIEFAKGLFIPSQVSIDVLKETFDINFFGVVAVTQAMLPLIRKSNAGRIVNVSSNLGSLTLHQQPSFQFYDIKLLGYDSSKTAVNAFTVHLAHELKDTNIKVNSAHPGWVKTDLGTDAAELTVEEGAATSVWLATLPEDGKTGAFFDQNQQPMPW